MPTIEPNPGHITQINHIKVAPADQEALVARMTEQLDRNMATRPGFISSTIHRSRDGHHVVNYVQWTTKELLDAAHARPEFRAQLETYKGYVIEAGPVLYDIAVIREEAAADRSRPSR